MPNSNVEEMVDCPECHGKGFVPVHVAPGWRNCPHCHGTGLVQKPAPQVCSHVGLGVPPPADPVT
jgi:DnaJ-class molecular chaperone